MQTAKRQFVDEGHRAGFREGANRMREDMMRLLPDATTVDSSDPKHVVIRQFIRQFPDPSDHGPYFRVPMAAASSLFFRTANERINARAKFVDFRPIRHAYTIDGSRLEWFTWEPTEGSAVIEARTSVLLKNFGMLASAAERIRSFVVMNMTGGSYAAMGDVVQAGVMLDEGVAEIRRVLGKFAPVEQLTPRSAFDRYIRYPMMNDRW